MKSLFDPSVNHEMVGRIGRLTAETPAQWGKMNVAQMLAHACIGFSMASGELKLKRGLIGILFGRMAKKKLLGDKPFDKNLPTDKKFVVSGPRNFEAEKKRLIAALERFAQSGPQGIVRDPHPFFGELAPGEWDTLMYKHLDHHLRQFGA